MVCATERHFEHGTAQAGFVYLYGVCIFSYCVCPYGIDYLVKYTVVLNEAHVQMNLLCHSPARIKRH